MSVRVPRPKPLRGFVFTRDWSKRSYPLLVIRRVGRNAGQQIYCAVGEAKTQWAYVANGSVQYAQTYRGVHSIRSDYFLKIFMDARVLGSVTLDCLVDLAKTICENPEPGSERRQPHAITNGYVRELLRVWRPT